MFGCFSCLVKLTGQALPLCTLNSANLTTSSAQGEFQDACSSSKMIIEYTVNPVHRGQSYLEMNRSPWALAVRVPGSCPGVCDSPCVSGSSGGAHGIATCPTSPDRIIPSDGLNTNVPLMLFLWVDAVFEPELSLELSLEFI